MSSLKSVDLFHGVAFYLHNTVETGANILVGRMVSCFNWGKHFFSPIKLCSLFLPLFFRASLISSHMRSNSGSSSEANIAWAVSFKLHARCLITLSEREGDSNT